MSSFLSTIITSRLETENSPRRRILTDWYVDSYPAYKDPKIKIYFLRGRVIQEADGTRPAYRITRTSPIAKCEANIVTTASGSQYTLEKPAPVQPHYPANPNMIPDTECNPWIDGNNWVSY